MESLIEKLNKNFNNKYEYLKLLEIVYDKNIMLCQITFLYPYQIEEMNQSDRLEIQQFIQKFFSLNAELKIKYKKSFLDEKLMKNDIIRYFLENKKALLPYLNEDNVSSTYHDQNVDIEIKLNQDVLSLLDEKDLITSLKEYLQKLYIAIFNINLIENEEKLPQEIVAEDIITTKTKTQRYDVIVEKKLIGDNIIPKPEFIKNNKKPKLSVILSGFIDNINQKKFIIKKGKNAGKEKSLYTFNLKDVTGVIECVYFCPKTHEKAMESLENENYLLMLGDINIGLNNKLTYYVKKITLASPITLNENLSKDDDFLKSHKQIVFPEKISQNSQSNLFEIKNQYDEFIMNNKFVVFDLETTGLDFENSEIIEIGAVKIENGKIIERFSSFSKPKYPIPIDVQKINNITNEMVEFAPKIEDVIVDFYNWSQDCIISGYNIIGFDMKFLNKVASKIGIKFENEIIDTMIVVRQSNLRVKNFKLITVTKALGINLLDAHRAYNDAEATAKVLLELHKIKTN